MTKTYRTCLERPRYGGFPTLRRTLFYLLLALLAFYALSFFPQGD